MRFGIITMQRESLVPLGVSREEALTYIATLDHADLARQLHSHGFDPIELSGDMALFLPQSFTPPTIERLVRLKRGSGVSYTVHLPLWSVELSTPLSPVRQGSVRAVIVTILRTLCLEPEVYVLHATGALAAEFYQMDLPDLAKALILRQFQGNIDLNVAVVSMSLTVALDHHGDASAEGSGKELRRRRTRIAAPLFGGHVAGDCMPAHAHLELQPGCSVDRDQVHGKRPRSAHSGGSDR